jgi:hypothetical protein
MDSQERSVALQQPIQATQLVFEALQGREVKAPEIRAALVQQPREHPEGGLLG